LIAKVVLCVKGHIGYLYSYFLLDIYVLNKFKTHKDSKT
jgi:hypothetical protein